jgi:hypothetical protein
MNETLRHLKQFESKSKSPVLSTLELGKYKKDSIFARNWILQGLTFGFLGSVKLIG